MMWRHTPPVLTGLHVWLREVRSDDAGPLIAELSTPDVTRFLAPPPPDPAAFDRFVSWATRQRRDGLALYLSVLPAGYDRAVGVMCLHDGVPDRSPTSWNWGFAVGSTWWGTGVFQEAARLTLAFAFDAMGLDHVDAWSLVANGRAHGALDRLGGVPELMRDACAPDGRRGTYIRWRLSRAAVEGTHG